MVQATGGDISAKELILAIGIETGKDYSTIIAALEVNEIETVEDLENLGQEDYQTLGFSIALKNRVKKIIEQR